jgi:cyclohexa-1,5-dienecarbonyl-CoA hydratase
MTTSTKTTVENGVGRIVIASPPLNIITRSMMREIREALAFLSADTSLRVLILSAEGKHFSAGADVGEHMPPEHKELIPEFTATVEALDGFPLPTIAAVHGRCLGGAFELIQPVDMVVATETALFGQPEIMLGVAPPIASVLLPSIGNWGAAAEIVFTGDAYSAQEAREAGFVLKTVAQDDLETATNELAARVSRHSAAALRSTKKTMKAARSRPRSEALQEAGRIYVDELMKTGDALEGLKAFTEKRKPTWKNS